ncbi:hypothetical protein BX666DRAFT_1977179 [Dichotomocladium elegans]|nr:hypothetical protein BX666DRAFT_1977179 [Dichotomocladium elegans]
MQDIQKFRNANLFWHAQEDSSRRELFAAADTPIVGTRDQLDLVLKRNARLIERTIRSHALELQQFHRDVLTHHTRIASDLGEEQPISGLEDKTGPKFLKDNSDKFELLLIKTANQSRTKDSNRNSQRRSAATLKRAEETYASDNTEIYNEHIDRFLDTQTSEWAAIRKYVASETTTFAGKLQQNGIDSKELLTTKAAAARQFYLLEDLPSVKPSSPNRSSLPDIDSNRQTKRDHSSLNDSRGLDGPPLQHQDWDRYSKQDMHTKGEVGSPNKRVKGTKAPIPIPPPQHAKTPKTQASPDTIVQVAIPIETPGTSASTLAAPPTVATAIPNSLSASSSSVRFQRNIFITDMGNITIRKMGSKGVQVVCEAKAGPICLGKPSQYDDANFRNDPEIRIGKRDGVRIYRRWDKGQLLDIGPVEKIEPLIRRYFLKSAHGPTRNADLL